MKPFTAAPAAAGILVGPTGGAVSSPPATTPAADRAGIISGDIILGVNVAAKSVGDLKKMVTPKNGHIALFIQRGADRNFLPVALG